jgi:hypothetical protein
VIPKRRRHHAGAHLYALRLRAEGAKPGEGKRGVSARVTPRLEVVADDNAVEANLLRVNTEIQQFDGSELLGRRLIA